MRVPLASADRPASSAHREVRMVPQVTAEPTPGQQAVLSAAADMGIRYVERAGLTGLEQSELLRVANAYVAGLADGTRAGILSERTREAATVPEDGPESHGDATNRAGSTTETPDGSASPEGSVWNRNAVLEQIATISRRALTEISLGPGESAAETADKAHTEIAGLLAFGLPEGEADTRPTPFELWTQAAGDRAEYARLLREHGHIIRLVAPVTIQSPACVWCDGSGVILVPDHGGESASEQDCPGTVHDAEREARENTRRRAEETGLESAPADDAQAPF